MKSSIPFANCKTSVMSDYEKAKKFQPTAELQFTVQEPKLKNGKTIEIVGELSNMANHEVSIIVFMAPHHGPFFAQLIESKDLKKRPSMQPPLPAVPPPAPLEVQIPALSSVRFVREIELADYTYPAKYVAQLEWKFLYWNDPKPAGTAAINLGNSGSKSP